MVKKFKLLIIEACPVVVDSAVDGVTVLDVVVVVIVVVEVNRSKILRSP